MKRFASIIAAMLFLVGAHVASIGSICIEDDGLHVNLSGQHGCCETEAASSCDSTDHCLDLSMEADFSRLQEPDDAPLFGPAMHAILIALDDGEPGLALIAGRAAPDRAPPHASHLDVLRGIRLLV